MIFGYVRLNGGAKDLLKASVFESRKAAARRLTYLLRDEYEFQRKIMEWYTNEYDFLSL